MDLHPVELSFIAQNLQAAPLGYTVKFTNELANWNIHQYLQNHYAQNNSHCLHRCHINMAAMKRIPPRAAARLDSTIKTTSHKHSCLRGPPHACGALQRARYLLTFLDRQPVSCVDKFDVICMRLRPTILSRVFDQT